MENATLGSKKTLCNNKAQTKSAQKNINYPSNLVSSIMIIGPHRRLVGVALESGNGNRFAGIGREDTLYNFGEGTPEWLRALLVRESLTFDSFDIHTSSAHHRGIDTLFEPSNVCSRNVSAFQQHHVQKDVLTLRENKLANGNLLLNEAIRIELKLDPRSCRGLGVNFGHSGSICAHV